MSIKISLLFAILHLATIYSQSASSNSRDQQKVQKDILSNIHFYDLMLWNQTPPEQNIQYNPISAEASINIFQIKYYYDSGIAYYYPKEGFLRQTFALANTIDSFQNSSNVKLQIRNVVFYNEKNNSQQFLDDVKTHFHGEIYKASFDFDPKDNATVLASINEWISKNTNGRGYKLEELTTSGKTYLQISSLSFTGCWDKPKSADSVKPLKFKTPKEEITIDGINAQEKLGYFNNSELKYEAIKLPYKNGEFAMAIVLPYQDHQSLESFKNLANLEKYHQIFDNITENEENIEYTIPAMNLNSITFNEKGTSVNGDNPIVCDTSTQQQQPTPNETYKPFHVDRPFAVFIYNVKTKFVLTHAFVRNPTSNYSTLNVLGSKGSVEVLKLQSSNLYELFHMLA